jgi:hypothetical protein
VIFEGRCAAVTPGRLQSLTGDWPVTTGSLGVAALAAVASTASRAIEPAPWESLGPLKDPA